MTRVLAVPYHQTTGVVAHDWLVTIRDETMSVPDVLEGWDYATPLTFACAVSVDLDAVRGDCRLSDDAIVSAVALHWASSTNRRGVGASASIEHSGDVTLQFTVDPTTVGGRLTLHRQLVLDAPQSPVDPFAASRAGSVLWEEEKSARRTVLLEGAAARFPTEVVDFDLIPSADPGSAWWLQHDFSDMDASPLASLRLFVNASHPRLSDLVAGRETDSTQLIRSVMSWDVGRRMIHAALGSDEFVDGWGQFRQGSLGETVELLIRRIWPTHDARSLRALRAEDSGLFESTMQGRFRLLEVP